MRNYKLIITILFLVANLIALWYLLGLGYFNSFLWDDYNYFRIVQQNGVFRFVHEMYYNAAGRYGGFFLSGILFSIIDITSYLISANIFTLIVGYSSIYFVCGLFSPNLPKLSRVMFSITFVHLFILSLYEISTFYWICAMPYILLIFATVFLYYFVFRNSTSKFYCFDLVIVFILSLIIGGSTEVYAPIVIILTSVFWLIYFVRHKVFFNRKIVKISLSVIILLIGFVLMIFAPSNQLRMNYEAEIRGVHPVGLDLIFVSFKAMISLFFINVPKLGYYLAVMPLTFYVGTLNKQSLGIIVSNKRFNMHVLLITFLFIALLFIGLMPGAYALNGFTVPRALSHYPFLFMLYFGYLGFLFGLKSKNKIFSANFLLFSVLFISLVSLFRIYEDFEDSRKFQQEIKNQHAQLLKLNEKGFRGIAKVKVIDRPLKISYNALLWNRVMHLYKPAKQINPYIYFPYMDYIISTDSNAVTNKWIKNYYKLNFTIIANSEVPIVW